MADENIPAEAINALNKAGHDTLWVKDWLPAAKDENVIKKAAEDTRTLITFDKDFGELVFKKRLPLPSGIIFLRIPAKSAEIIAKYITSLLEKEMPWHGHFAVATLNDVRLTPLPR